MINRFIILFITCVIGLSPMIHAEECTISFRVENAYPFHFKTEKGTWDGIFYDQAKAIAKEVHCKLIPVELPWPRALEMLKQGNLDMMSWMSYTNERAEYLHFIGPHYYEKMKLMVNKDFKHSIRSLDDLFKLPHKIVLVKEAWYGKELMKRIKIPANSRKINWITSEKHLPPIMDAIRKNRISGYVTTQSPGLFKNPIYRDLIFHPFLINNAPLYIGLSKRSISPELAEKMNQAVKKLRKKGLFRKIIKKFE